MILASWIQLAGLVWDEEEGLMCTIKIVNCLKTVCKPIPEAFAKIAESTKRL